MLSPAILQLIELSIITGVLLIACFGIGLFISDSLELVRPLIFGGIALIFLSRLLNTPESFGNAYYLNLTTELLGTLLIAIMLTDVVRFSATSYMLVVLILLITVFILIGEAFTKNMAWSLNLGTELLGALFVTALFQPYRGSDSNYRRLVDHIREFNREKMDYAILVCGSTPEEIKQRVDMLHERFINTGELIETSYDEKQELHYCVLKGDAINSKQLRGNFSYGSSEVIMDIRARQSTLKKIEPYLERMGRYQKAEFSQHGTNIKQWRVKLHIGRKTGQRRGKTGRLD